MKRLVCSVTLLVILAGLLLSGVADTSASVTDRGILDSQVATSTDEAGDSSVSATITRTMTPVFTG